MILTSSIKKFGQYCLFLARVFRIPDKWSEFGRNTINEISKLGVDSMSPLIPAYSVGLATREILLLEFSSSILSLILAGKVGSNIASEIGTMRVTEQIDAMEIMGVNSANYIVMPKIVGFVLFVPVLVVLSMFMGLLGGWGIAFFTDMISVENYIYGIQTMFEEWYVWYGIIKTFFFAFIITSVAAFFGYYVKGGALEVGKASTNAVVVSSIMILFMDVVLTSVASLYSRRGTDIDSRHLPSTSQALVHGLLLP